MATPAWMDHAWAELGQREVSGANDNPHIVALYRDAGHPEAIHDEVAWCAAFVGACLARAQCPGTGSLMARSYLAWGSALTEGRLGAIAVFSRGADPAAGHVAFYLDADGENIHVLGGNQGDAVTVTAISRDRLLGLRWPYGDQPPAAQTDSVSPPAPPVTATANKSVPSLFDTALTHVLEMEGGWTEDPHDPGGPTNFGITLATFAAHRSTPLDATTFPVLRQQLKTIGRNEVRSIYEARYWIPCRAPQLPVAVAIMHFDAAVNHGVGTAARMLQEAAGVTVDGDIGPETIAACGTITAERLLHRYAEIRRARYRALPTFWRFGRGWLARVEATLRAATLTSQPQPDGEKTMTTTQPTAVPTPSTPEISASQTGAVGASKWWGESMTMWGAIITGAATVVPALGPIIGIDITGEMIRQLGTHSVQAVQAIGGLAGTIMTIYGRVRANSRLGLKSVTLQV